MADMTFSSAMRTALWRFFSKGRIRVISRITATAATAKIDKMAAEGKIIPPHIKDYQNSTNVFYGVFGWYAKTNDGVIGIIKLSFSCRSPENKDLYDDAYYVVKYGSDEITPVDRDDLLDLPGHNFVYSGAYDDKGKVPSDWPEWLS